MSKTITEIIEEANTIATETVKGKNTAERVGGCIKDAAEYVQDFAGAIKEDVESTVDAKMEEVDEKVDAKVESISTLQTEVKIIKDELGSSTSETEITATLSSRNLKVGTDGSITTVAGRRYSVYNVSSIVGSTIRIKRDVADSGVQYAFYSVMPTSETNVSTKCTADTLILLGDNLETSSTIDTTTVVPDNSVCLYVQSNKNADDESLEIPYVATIVEGENRLDTIESNIETNKDDIKSVESQLSTTTDVTSETYINDINNYYTDIDTGLLVTTGGGHGVQKYDVSAYIGKTIRVKRDATSFTRTNAAQWAIYNKIVDAASLITSDNVVKVADTNPSNALDEYITIPDGSVAIYIFGRNSAYPATVTITISSFDSCAKIDNKNFPTYDGWSSGGSVNPSSYDNFKTIFDGNKIVYGGANLLYKKKLLSFGDSLQEGGQWLRNISVMACITFTTYAMGGKQTTPSSAQYSPLKDKFCSMQDFIRDSVDDSVSADIITYENVNDINRCFSESSLGTLSDKPFFVSQYIDYNNGYTSADSAKQGFIDNFSSIISEKSAKKGSICDVAYTTTAYTITLSGTTAAGSMIISVGSESKTIATTSGQSLSDVASYIATFDFSGYSTTASGSVVTFTPQDGTESSEPIISSNTTGLTCNISTATSTSYVFYYFVGFASEWTDLSKWTTDVPSLTACLKGSIEAICANYPSSRLIIVQPISAMRGASYYDDGSADMYSTANNAQRVAMDALKKRQNELAEMYHIECIDVENLSGVNLLNKSNYFGDDNIHYNDNGKLKTAEVIYHYLMS